MLDRALDKTINYSVLYAKRGTQTKREITSLIFRKKIRFN